MSNTTNTISSVVASHARPNTLHSITLEPRFRSQFHASRAKQAATLAESYTFTRRSVSLLYRFVSTICLVFTTFSSLVLMRACYVSATTSEHIDSDPFSMTVGRLHWSSSCSIIAALGATFVRCWFALWPRGFTSVVDPMTWPLAVFSSLSVLYMKHIFVISGKLHRRDLTLESIQGQSVLFTFTVFMLIVHIALHTKLYLSHTGAIAKAVKGRATPTLMQ